MSTEGSGETPSNIPSLPGVPEQTYLFPKAKGHSRSISHGGTPTLATGMTIAGPRQTVAPLKSALRGHQRAFSHGQIGEGGRPPSTAGHSRTGSRTDFILPPGHRDRDPPITSSQPRSGSVRAHSRQASRSESIYTLRRNSEIGNFRKALFWITRRNQPSIDNRHIIVIPNHLVPDKTPPKDHPNGKRCSNKIRTTKYTLLSFIPKNFFEQFHRIANIYFIFIVLLNWVPSINAFGKEIAMFPVLFVLGITALKDLFEDRRRNLSDQRINNSHCRVYKKSSNRYERVKWCEVKVGDLVHLSNNEAVPADMVLLHCSSPTGVCYVDSCNLDGETNLKQRVVVNGFKDKHLTFRPEKFRSTVEVERPSTKIYKFNGIISHADGCRVPISSDNLLLRECTIKNTDFVEGIVVYAGNETKAMLNNGGPRYKCSKLEKKMNTDIIWCILVLLFLCCAGAVGCKLWFENYYYLTVPPPFIPQMKSPAYEGLLIFWTFIIVLQVMIPISLYVTIEVTKLMQVYHIHQDVEMYDEEKNTRAVCRALNITEELGQIQYLFSDKTGTLTENKMLFRRCVVEGEDYDHPPGDPAPAPPAPLPPLVTPLTTISPNARLLHSLLHPDADTDKVKEFITVMALCNTVMVGLPHVDNIQTTDSAIFDTSSTNGIQHTSDKYARLAESRSSSPLPPPPRTPPLAVCRYEAESPDELALVEAAFGYGYELRARRPDEVELGERGDLRLIRVLRVQEFDSSRKCMSIALKIDPQQVVVYVKGADSTVLGALAPMRAGSAEAAAYTRTKSLLAEYARSGLRTLVLAKRTMSPALWEEWLASHNRALDSLDSRDRLVRESLARLESALSLLGATGVEDRLQEAVPRTVRSLLDAGVVVWVLTGDKPETAINIAYSASLFSQQDRVLQLMARDKDHAESSIHAYLEAGGSSGAGQALVVDGRTLTYILDRRSGLVAPFLALARRCSSVLCCRATPLQKAYIVKAVKEELGVTTLAIGDGANDVSMIQTADVGVGLSGLEGKQAVMASDFSLSRFKYIERLMLVHGHWCYDRLSRMILYFFEKNAIFVFLLFWFQFYCGFSAMMAIEQLHVMLYNLVFTACPPIIIGAFERCAPASLLLNNPGLYAVSRRGLKYRAYDYWLVLAESLYASSVVFFVAAVAYADTDCDLWKFGSVNMTCCLVVMIAFVAVETRSWTIVHVMALLVSLALFYVLTMIFHSLPFIFLNQPFTYYNIFDTMQDPTYWLVVVLTTVTALTPRVVWRAIRNTVCPDVMGRVVLSRRRGHRTRLPYSAHYHTTTSSAHVYRATDDESVSKLPSQQRSLNGS